MKNLAINIPSINDATSFYRGAYPLAALRERCKYLNGLSINTWSEAVLRVSDAVFFQRPHTDDHRGAMEMALEVGRRVWLDYDDYLFGVPTDNPTHQKYGSKAVKDNVAWMLQNAHVITVSTKHLATLLKEFNPNIKVVPNAVDMGIKCMKDRPAQMHPRRKIMAWRGSHTHQRDVFTYTRAILQTSMDPAHKDWFWHFIGDRLWFLTDSMPHHQTFVTKAMGPVEYHRHIERMHASAFIVPLADSDFNRAKSNIAWMEAAYAGAVAICPDWEEWQVPGAIRYKNEAEFMAAMYAVIKGEINVESTAKNSWDYIQENLTLAKVNETRIDVLCELFECDRKDLGV